MFSNSPSHQQRAQVNIEYILLALFLLLLLLPVVYYGLQSSYENYRLLQTGNILHELGTAADDLHQIGTGNRRTVVVEFPSGITGAVVKGNVVSIKTDTRKGRIPLVHQTEVKLVGGFTAEKGTQFIPVTALTEDLVRIGKGVALFSATPSCISPPQLPAQITLLGDEIDETTVLLSDGVPYPSSLVSYVNFYTLLVTVTTSEFVPKLNGNPYTLQLQKGNEISSPILLYSYPAPNFCGTLNSLATAELHDQATHTFIEEITTNVAEDDGYYKQISPGQLVHLSFPNTMRQGDFLAITSFCSADGTISLLREGTSTVIGTVTCAANTWQTLRLFITAASAPSPTFDLIFSSDIDIDYVDGFTI